LESLMTVTEREQAELCELYADFAAAWLMPPWTPREDEPAYEALGVDRRQPRSLSPIRGRAGSSR
jgi:hypothetical protein